jgi:hypothetical protein
MLKQIHQIKYLPALLILFNLVLIGIPLQAIAQRRLFIFSGDIPGRRPGCSIISIDNLSNSQTGRELLALEDGMTPQQVQAIISGNPSEPYRLIYDGAKEGVMRYSADKGRAGLKLTLGFRNNGLNAISLSVTDGNVDCQIAVEDL